VITIPLIFADVDDEIRGQQAPWLR